MIDVAIPSDHNLTHKEHEKLAVAGPERSFRKDVVGGGNSGPKTFLQKSETVAVQNPQGPRCPVEELSLEGSMATHTEASKQAEEKNKQTKNKTQKDIHSVTGRIVAVCVLIHFPFFHTLSLIKGYEYSWWKVEEEETM